VTYQVFDNAALTVRSKHYDDIDIVMTIDFGEASSVLDGTILGYVDNESEVYGVVDEAEPENELLGFVETNELVGVVDEDQLVGLIETETLVGVLEND